MNKEVIERALTSALYLLNSEFESVTISDLREEYLSVISQIEKALFEIEKPTDGKA